MTKVVLSKRLLAIANLVDKKSSIIDVGCDHALLDIYLSQNKIIKKSIASDVVPGPIDMAKKNLLKYEINNIELRISDGLDSLTKKDEIDTVIMSGLGNQKITSILKKDLSKLDGINCIIIQSNTGYDKIRKEVVSLEYYIKEEILVEDNDIIYAIIKFAKGNKKYTKKELYFGPLLLKNKNELFYKMIDIDIKKNDEIIKKLPKRKIFKKIKLYIRNIKLKKEIQ